MSAHVHQVHQQKILGNSFLTLYVGWCWEMNKQTQQPSNHTSLKSTASGARVVSSRWMSHKKKKKKKKGETHGCPHGPSLCLIQAEGIITIEKSYYSVSYTLFLKSMQEELKNRSSINGHLDLTPIPRDCHVKQFGLS